MIKLEDVVFENVNIIVPYDVIDWTNDNLPGLLSVQYFGSVEIKNVTVKFSTFIRKNSEQSYYSAPFYFDHIRKLVISGLVAENLYLTSEFLIVKNLTNDSTMSTTDEPKGPFLNLPCARY